MTVGNINIVNVNSNDQYEITYLPILMSFTCYGKPTNDVGYYYGVASVSLAMEHLNLNTGNGSIVPEISGLNETCPLRFTTKSFEKFDP